MSAELEALEAATIYLTFKPWHAILGGLAIGTVSAGKTSITGRILGISGTIKGWFSGDFSPWRGLFMGGLVCAGLAATQFLPTAFEVFPATFTLFRAVSAGLLVGVGSAMGNGCTSGHGIAGNARLSMRSLVFTCTFFVAGIAAVALTGTVDSLGIAQAAPPYTPPTASELTTGCGIVAAAMLGTVGFGAAARNTQDKVIGLAYDFFAGIIFGLGLCFSKMTRASEVASALALFEPSWNLSLWFVMAGGVGIALPLFQLLVMKQQKALDGSPMNLPKRKDIDWRLIVGAVLFGAGWGVGGMCPGPAVVSLAKPQAQNVVMVLAMFAGMWLNDTFFTKKQAASAPA